MCSSYKYLPYGTRVAARNRTTTNAAPVTMENGEYVSVAGYGDLTRPLWGSHLCNQAR